ncbi:hypothetical protein ACJ73_01656 [Blastomyces percursus]|uniref:Uncharacterized protein n=1 Tax=Blastomyces percursus TaxID=1658174 RepID=A0A1J9QFS6_9EURO|nr:hypothetical protein ACJ73_01656 [Blastomyces percursus]
MQVPLQYLRSWCPSLAWARDLLAIASCLLASFRVVQNRQLAHISYLEGLLHQNNIDFKPLTPLTEYNFDTIDEQYGVDTAEPHTLTENELPEIVAELKKADSMVKDVYTQIHGF